MKSKIQNILQNLLGFNLYLFIFSIFIIHTLRWNKKERDFLHFIRMIPDGTRVLDLGANIGIMSVWLGKKLPKSQIVSFEPMPQNIKALKRVLKFYGLKNIEVIEKALGNENGETTMLMPVLNNVKKQGLSHVVHDSITELNDGNTVKVPMVKLDDCDELIQDSMKLSAIKLDVENFEYFVLQGGQKLITLHRPLVYTELWENENRTNCFNLMKSMGYTINVLIKNQLVAYEPKKHNTQNFFFIP